VAVDARACSPVRAHAQGSVLLGGEVAGRVLGVGSLVSCVRVGEPVVALCAEDGARRAWLLTVDHQLGSLLPHTGPSQKLHNFTSAC
jgi:hypothetical protein